MNMTYLLFALPGLLLGMWAQNRVQGTFARFSQTRTSRNITGAQVARALLDAYGLYNVKIERVAGTLTDHYDPGAKVLRLSQVVHDSPSIAAAGVAAHEMGHALQDAENYAPLRLRGGLVPAVRAGGWLGPIMLMGGVMLQIQALALVGLVLFGATAVFSLVTLPVEFDASKRAKLLLVEQGLMNQTELQGVDKVLDAAALTYVAAAIQAVGTVLYYGMLVLGNGDRRR